jgi:predicted 2-oxoglutarate/Fe(II)-dependent dioxygenase YbiX
VHTLGSDGCMIATQTSSNLAPWVKIYNNPITATQTLQAIQKLDEWRTHTWYDAATKQNHSYDTAELEVRAIDDQPELLKACQEWVGACVERYMADVSMPASITSISKPRLNRYPPGAMMRQHVDHIHSLFDGEHKGVPVLTILAALNDDYTGGDFLLCGQRVNLAAGDAIVFPSNFMFPHAVEPVKTGTRYSFVSWAW